MKVFILLLSLCRSDSIIIAHISAVFMSIICKGWFLSSINPAAKRIKIHAQQRLESGPGGQDQQNSIALRSAE